MAKKSPSINLLKDQGSLVDRFVNWSLSVGRVVVIVTEVIALLAFLYRFSLDRQLIDIHSKIRQEQAVLGYLKENENTYRNLQNRITLSAKFTKEGKEKIQTLKDLVTFAQNSVSFNNITIQEDKIRIDANGSSVNSVSDFVKRLKEYQKVSTVIIDKIENRPSAASINVSITAVLKKI